MAFELVNHARFGVQETFTVLISILWFCPVVTLTRICFNVLFCIFFKLIDTR